MAMSIMKSQKEMRKNIFGTKNKKTNEEWRKITYYQLHYSVSRMKKKRKKKILWKAHDKFVPKKKIPLTFALFIYS